MSFLLNEKQGVYELGLLNSQKIHRQVKYGNIKFFLYFGRNTCKMDMTWRGCKPQSAFCLAINQSFHKVPEVWYVSETLFS